MTISVGSIMYLKVAGIKSDFNDYTLSLSNNLLQAFAGDQRSLYQVIDK